MTEKIKIRMMGDSGLIRTNLSNKFNNKASVEALADKNKNNLKNKVLDSSNPTYQAKIMHKVTFKAQINNHNKNKEWHKVNFLGVNSRDSRVKEVSIISVMYSNRINK
jgi:hypothetical protein